MSEALADEYGTPRHCIHEAPFDVLVYILLSNRTSAEIANDTFDRLKAAFSDWYSLGRADQRKVIELLKPAGLARKRATSLIAIARQVEGDFGPTGLEALAEWDTDVGEAYLCGLPGVSVKVAKCLLMFAFGREVLPVDVHVHRLTERLEWHTHRRADQSHDSLERIVPPALRYQFHVNAIAHGRAVCTSQSPKCSECVLRPFCAYPTTKRGSA